jgi:hypothetical protein
LAKLESFLIKKKAESSLKAFKPAFEALKLQSPVRGEIESHSAKENMAEIYFCPVCECFYEKIKEIMRDAKGNIYEIRDDCPKCKNKMDYFMLEANFFKD